MINQEPTNLDILQKIESSNTEILQIINNYATHIEEEIGGIKTEIGGIKTEIGGIKTEIGGIKTEIGGIKATMVTKDYLDDKLSDLKGDIIITMRKEDMKFKALVEILQKRNLISSEDVRTVLSMQPFPQMYI